MTFMFNRAEVDAAGSPLVRLLRLIFFRNKITLDRFSMLCGEHGRRMGKTTSMINTDRCNMRKTLTRRDDMTWRFFQYVLLNILRLEIEEIRLVIRTDTGALIEIGSKDSVDAVAKLVNPAPGQYPTKAKEASTF